MTRRGRRAPAVAVLLGALVMLAPTLAVAQRALVTVEGRVLWIAGETMVVAPYADADAIEVDLSQADLDEYMTLAEGDSVAVTGSIDGNRLVAMSIRNDTS